MTIEYSEEQWNRIFAVLGRPFKKNEIKTYTAKGQTLAYLNARQVMDRLDEAVGPYGWSDRYEVIDEAKKAVQCMLTIGGLTKVDIGYPNADVDSVDKNGKPLSEEPLKAAYSDAFKRAAVKWGVGRNLTGEQRALGPVAEQVRAILEDKDNPHRLAVRQHIIDGFRPLTSLSELAQVPTPVLEGALARAT